MQENNRDLTVYVLLRTDLPSMNTGKAAAQVHHSGVQMVAKHGENPMVQDYIMDGKSHGADCFNTTIVLGSTLDDITQRVASATRVGEEVMIFNTVEDPSYPFLVENQEIASLIPTEPYGSCKQIKVLTDGRVLMVRPEITCAWFLGSRTDPRFTSLFNGLELHP
jgi:peptidyl-tRNA hydrolase